MKPNESFDTALAVHKTMQYELDMMLVKGTIDEIGILFTSEEDANEFAIWMDKNNHPHHADAQVVYRLRSSAVGDVREYAYHCLTRYFPMNGFVIQAQVQLKVNPLTVVIDKLFEGAQSGFVVHGSFRTPDLQKFVNEEKPDLLLDRFYTNNGQYAYFGVPGKFPYLQIRE